MVECRFAISDIGGTTPKFHCVLSTGIEVRVKYGRGEELPAEAAATRLLAALGFGADHITMVERLRCHGCPKEPFYTMKIVEATRTQRLYERVLDDESHEDFTWVAMERKFEATAIEAPNQKGWAFYELDAVDPHRGGAPRAHVDALRLLAVFLAHWDNKADNQRLVCLSTPWPQGTPCREPFLLLQDVGSTFGPLRLDLEAWERSIIWADRATCTVSMRHMPYGGATFRPIRISEDGRQFLIKRLGALSDAHVTGLLSWARFDRHEGLFTHPRPIAGVGSRFQEARADADRRPTLSGVGSQCSCRCTVSADRSVTVLVQVPRINRPTGSRDRLKVQLVAVDLDQHEVVVAIE
jgi:hypothetical protein